jgi:antitoxin MazE
MQIARWGNSLAVRLPAKLLQELQLKEGDNLEVHATGTRTFEVRKQMTREEAIENLRKLSRPLPVDYKFNREEANERGD